MFAVHRSIRLLSSHPIDGSVQRYMRYTIMSRCRHTYHTRVEDAHDTNNWCDHMYIDASHWIALHNFGILLIKKTFEMTDRASDGSLTLIECQRRNVHDNWQIGNLEWIEINGQRKRTNRINDSVHLLTFMNVNMIAPNIRSRRS